MSRNSDPVMPFELGLEEMVVNIMCAYAPQVGCIVYRVVGAEEHDDFENSTRGVDHYSRAEIPMR